MVVHTKPKQFFVATYLSTTCFNMQYEGTTSVLVCVCFRFPTIYFTFKFSIHNRMSEKQTKNGLNTQAFPKKVEIWLFFHFRQRAV